MKSDPAHDGAADTTRVAWHHFILSAPRTWEPVAYKNEADDGRLILSTRDGEVLQIFWKQVKEAPSLAHRLVDLARANFPRDIEVDETRLRRRLDEVHGWQVYRTTSRSVPFFALRWLDQPHILLTLVFPTHPDTEEGGVRDEVLASFAPNEGDERVWALFGLDVTLPAAYQPAEIVPYPVAQQLVFEHRRGHEIKAYRFGMMPEILGGDDIGAFFARLKGRATRLRYGGAARIHGRHDGVELTYTTRGKSGGMAAIFDRRWQGRILAWRRDDLKRLFAIEQHAPEPHLLANLAERMACP